MTESAGIRAAALAAALALLAPGDLPALEEPLPPPEIGERLASYRTNRQLAEAAGAAARAAPARENRRAGRAAREISTGYEYVPGRNVPVYGGGETVLRFTEGATGRPVRVRAVTVSNGGFSAESDGFSVIILSAGPRDAARVRVVLEGREDAPLVFGLNRVRTGRDLRNVENVRL